jgi:3',5'-cyclic AMP phosphodiesterase CpdA
MFTDNYLHRNYNLYNKILNPDSIIFVGDLYDGGREWNDTPWMHEYKRFNKIFISLKGVRQLKQVPGNHDAGFGNGIDFEKYSRFKVYFGNADEVVLLGNHSIVLLDTVSCHVQMIHV